MKHDGAALLEKHKKAYQHSPYEVKMRNSDNLSRFLAWKRWMRMRNTRYESRIGRVKFASVFPPNSYLIQIFSAFSLFFLALFPLLQVLLCFYNSFSYFILISFLFVIDCCWLILIFIASSESIAATNTVAWRMCAVAFRQHLLFASSSPCANMAN